MDTLEMGVIIAAAALFLYVVVERKRLTEFWRTVVAPRLQRSNAGALLPVDAEEHLADTGTDDPHSITAEWVDGSIQGWTRANWQLDIYARTDGPIEISGLRFWYWPVGASALKRERGPSIWQPRPIGQGREREAGTIEFPLDWIPDKHRNGQADAAGLVEILAEVDYTDESTGRSGTVTAGPRLIQNVPPLSSEARTLLLEGAIDSARTIYRVRGGLGGTPTTFLVNRKTFGEGADARTEAAWEAGLDQLEGLALVRAEGYKRAAFKLTAAGFDSADAFAPQAKVRVRFERGTESSTAGDGRDRLLLEWKGTLELYNTEPQDVFGLNLELKPGQDGNLTELQYTHLRSGEAVRIDVLVSRQFDREEVVACRDRFAELLPDDLRSLTCRLSYVNSEKVSFYTLFHRGDETEECKYLRGQPKWPDP